MRAVLKGHFKLIIVTLLSNFFTYNTQKLSDFSISDSRIDHTTEKVASYTVNLLQKLLYGIYYLFQKVLYGVYYNILYIPYYYSLKGIKLVLKLTPLKYLKKFIRYLLRFSKVIHRYMKSIYKPIFKTVANSLFLKVLLGLSSFFIALYTLQMLELINVFIHFGIVLREFETPEIVAEKLKFIQSIIKVRNKVKFTKKLIANIFTLVVVIGIILLVSYYQTQIKAPYEFVKRFYGRVQTLQRTMTNLEQARTELVTEGGRIMHVAQDVGRGFIPLIIFLGHLTIVMGPFSMFANLYYYIINFIPLPGWINAGTVLLLSYVPFSLSTNYVQTTYNALSPLLNPIVVSTINALINYVQITYNTISPLITPTIVSTYNTISPTMVSAITTTRNYVRSINRTFIMRVILALIINVIFPLISIMDVFIVQNGVEAMLSLSEI